MYKKLLSVPCDNEAITHSDGLSVQNYTDPAHFEIEKQRIFQRSWICVGHQCMAKQPGDYFVTNVIDQSVLVVRDNGGRLKAFFNVCRHRGHEIARGSGHCDRLVCPYHAWSYDLDGQLLNAPHTERVNSFDPKKVSLKPISLSTLAGAVFVNLDHKAPPLHSVFDGVEAEIVAHKPTVHELDLVYDNPIAHHCNWKISVENFSECYHCAPVHGYLTSNIIDPDSYQLSARALVQRHVIKARDSSMTQRLWHFWPNTAMGLYPIPNIGTVWCIRHMYPMYHDKSIYQYRWFCEADGPVEAVREYAVHHAETTGAEDAAVAAGVQRGINSLGFEHAQLFSTPQHGVSSEHVIKYFHDLIKAAIS